MLSCNSLFIGIFRRNLGKQGAEVDIPTGVGGTVKDKTMPVLVRL